MIMGVIGNATSFPQAQFSLDRITYNLGKFEAL